MEGTNVDWPIITIVVTTYLPDGEEGLVRKYAEETTRESWDKYLIYGGDIHLHIANDDTQFYYNSGVFDQRWKNISYTYQNRHGVGASLNAGFRKAFDTSPLVLYAVGDWALTESFDLTPWAQLLMEKENVGMVRLGPPHPGITGTVEAFTTNWQGWGLRLKREGFAFAHRPALYHKRMIDTYGWFKEDCSALECEKNYAEKFCEMRGPSIVLALPHPWLHLESVELAYIDPKES